MAGFLDKKNRLIDFKITENGREQMSKGDIRFKYYTFSDQSIFYEEDHDVISDFKISSSLKSFLPFEVDSELSYSMNTELYLDKIAKYSEVENNILFASGNVTQGFLNKTLSDRIIEKKFLDTKTLIPNFSSRDIVFSVKEEKDIFDFKNQNYLIGYPTIKLLEDDISNLETIENDKRFFEKLRTKTLPPITLEELDKEEEINGIEFIFKTLDIEEANIDINQNRNNVIVDILDVISKTKSIHKLEYHLNDDNKKSEDAYIFEMHKKEENETINEEKLTKLSFIKLGSFFKKVTHKEVSVYLIGKLVLTSFLDREKNPENFQMKYKIDKDYSFVNMFTMVVE